MKKILFSALSCRGRRNPKRTAADGGHAAEQNKETEVNTLKDVQVGKTATVKKLHGEGAVKRRIMDMGITKGVEVFIRKVAPLGDPVEVNLRGYELSIRKTEAELIEVE